MSTFEAICNGDGNHFEDEFLSEVMDDGEDVECFPDEFRSDSMDDGEDVNRYRLGGLHPVHIGDQLDGTRYKVIQKLGHGASSTVWLARDLDLHKYVAVKIKESGLSNLYNELNILKHLSEVESDHPGRIYSSASLLLRNFWIVGPNGLHLALVLQVRGPSISRSNYWKIRLHSCLARTLALQVTQGLEYLHSVGICHGDINSSHVLFQLADFDSWSEDELEVQLGKPRMFHIERGPGRPRYLVDSASFFDAEPRLLTKSITIVDHGESFFVNSPPHELSTTNHFTAPEVSFGWDASFHSDIWELGCVIFEMRAGHHLFAEAVGGITEMLGSLPPSWNHVRFNEEGYLEQYGSHVPNSTEMMQYPLHEQVNWIEDKQISPPDVNGLEGPQARTESIYLIERSSTEWLARAAINNDMAPFQISGNESTRLTDLLCKILTHKPEDRISLGDLTTHPWLTGSGESTQNTTMTTII